MRVDGGGADNLLRKIHQPLIIDIGGIKFHHRKFGIVARRNTFVPKIAIDFKDALKAANDQAF